MKGFVDEEELAEEPEGRYSPNERRDNRDRFVPVERTSLLRKLIVEFLSMPSALFEKLPIRMKVHNLVL